MTRMLTIRVRRKYRVISEFEIPAYRFEGDKLSNFVRAIYVANITKDAEEMIPFYVNSRKGEPVRNIDSDLRPAYHPERREVGSYCGTPDLLVEVMQTLSEVQYEAFDNINLSSG